VNGYVPGVEDRSMFGSKCIVLNDDYVDITDWEYPTYVTSSYVDQTYNVNSANTRAVELRLNLTQILYKYFMESCPKFTDNWSELFTINNDVYIKNYIKMSLLKYFDITDKKNFTLYSKTYGQTNQDFELSYTFPEDFDANWNVVDNYESEYENINDEIILTVTISDYTNRKFYPTFKITR